jgi:hypothetical protein
MSGSHGARQVWSAASKSIGYNSHRCGSLPQPYDAEGLCQQIFEVLWASMLTSVVFARALSGERVGLSRPERVKIIDVTLKLLSLEEAPVAEAMSPAEAGEILDRAFLYTSRETPLYGEMKGFLITLIERVIRKARARRRVEAGSGPDGERLRRYLARDVGLTEALCETLLGDEDQDDVAIEGMDFRVAFARLNKLERAICRAYFMDEATLQTMAGLPWSDDSGKELRLSIHQIRDIRDRGIRRMKRLLGARD